MTLYDVASILTHALPGVVLEERREQNEMADAVLGVLTDGGALMVEAGTGVGKSFAYLLPAMEAALSGQGPLVISTHTLNLQEQLFFKDAPIIARALMASGNREPRMALLKGRGNYLSRRRLRYAMQSGVQMDLSGADGALERILDRSLSPCDGTQSSFGFQVASELWGELKSDPYHCQGARCETFEACYYQKARRMAAAADVVFVNHALLLSDLALKMDEAPGILPDYKALIVD